MPRVTTILRRAIVPGLLLAGGAVMVVYGAAGRRLPVWEEALVKKEVTEEQEIEIPFEVPVLPDPGGFAPDGMPGPGPPPFVPKMKQTVVVTVVKKVETEQVVPEPEYVLVREVTVGGIRLADLGEGPAKLMRTYRRPEAGWEDADLPPPPQLCPT